DVAVKPLRQRMSRHQERLEADAAVLNDLLAFDPGNEAERLRRYEQTPERQFSRAIPELVTIRRAGPRTPATRPGPAAPAPPADPAAPPPADPASELTPAPITTSEAAVATLSQACDLHTPPSPEADLVPSVGAADKVLAVPAGDPACAVPAVGAVHPVRVVGA